MASFKNKAKISKNLDISYDSEEEIDVVGTQPSSALDKHTTEAAEVACSSGVSRAAQTSPLSDMETSDTEAPANVTQILSPHSSASETMDNSIGMTKESAFSVNMASNTPATDAAPPLSSPGSDSDIDVVGSQNSPQTGAMNVKEHLNLPAAKTASNTATFARGSASQTARKIKIPEILATLPTLPIELNSMRVSASICDEHFGLKPYIYPPKPNRQCDQNTPSSAKPTTSHHRTPAQQPTPKGAPTEKANSSQSEDEAPHFSWPLSATRPKPIIITEKYSVSVITKGVKDTLGHSDFFTKVTEQGCEVHCKDAASRKKLRDFLREAQISTLSQKPNDDEGCKIFIRYLNKDTPLEWISGELSSLGYGVISVNAVRNRVTGEAYHGFAARLETPTSKDIFNVKQLGNQKVIIEPQRPQLVQCQRCQKFGHSKDLCSLPFACVKCAGKHPTSDCTKSSSVVAKCANCSGAHTASYRGCGVYQAALSHHRKTTQSTPHAIAQAYTRPDPEFDEEVTQKGVPSATRAPSDADLPEIKKLSEEVETIQSKLHKIKRSISAQQCQEQMCSNCCSSTLHPNRRQNLHSCCTALTASKHLSTISSTDEYISWRQLRMIARQIQDTIAEIKHAERSSKLTFSTPISAYNSELQLLVRDFMPLLVKLNIICDKNCPDNSL